MSFRVRIIIQNALDSQVYSDRSVEVDGPDYQAIPDLIDRAHADTRRYVGQVGAYALVHGHAPELARPEGADS